jgi:hypothetical protein
MAEIASADPRLATGPLPAHNHLSDARLPVNYEQAKAALVQCSRIDECQEWAIKADALASYARQAHDDTLRKLADRIHARAVRRCGELLKQLDGRQGQNLPGAESGDAGDASTSIMTRREAAEQAGLSKDQQVTAVRVANVPAGEFEQAVESDKPPTVTALAGMGKQSRPAAAAESSTAPEPPPPSSAAMPASATAPCITAPVGFIQATHLIGTVRDFAAFCEKNDPVVVADGLPQSEVHEVRSFVGVIDGWLDRFVVNLSPDVRPPGSAFPNRGA